MKKSFFFLIVTLILVLVCIVNVSTSVEYDDTIYKSIIKSSKEDDGSGTYMSVSEFPGELEVFTKIQEDGSGRQIWSIRLVEGSVDMYNIFTESGITPKKVILSAAEKYIPDKSQVKLLDIIDLQDTNSAYQQWRLNPVNGKPDYYTLEIDSGKEGLQKNILSAIPNSNKLDFWFADDGSGRQQWFIPDFKKKPSYTPIKEDGGQNGDKGAKQCYFKHSNACIKDNNVFETHNSNLNTCEEKCNKEPRCLAYEFNRVNKKCQGQLVNKPIETSSYCNAEWDLYVKTKCQIKDQSIKNLDQALSLIDFSKVATQVSGSELGDDSIFNALPFQFWVSSEEGKSETWGSALLSIKTHFGFYVKSDSPSQGSKVSQTKQSVTSDKLIPEKYKDDADKVAFKNSMGLYLSCQPDGSLKANRHAANSWESFQIYTSDYCPNKNLGSSCVAIKSSYTDQFRKSERWVRASIDGTLKCDLEKFEYVSQLFYGWTTQEAKETEQLKFNFASAKWKQTLLAESFFELPAGSKEVPLKFQYDISKQNKVDWINSRKSSDKTYSSDDGKIVITDPGYQKKKSVQISDTCVGKADAKVKCITKLMNSTLEVDYTVSRVYDNGLKMNEIQSTWKGQVLHTVLEIE